MKYRIAWDRAAHWANGSRYAALMSVIVPIDRCANFVALLLGFAGLFYSRMLRPLGGFNQPGRKPGRIHRILLNLWE